MFDFDNKGFLDENKMMMMAKKLQIPADQMKIMIKDINYNDSGVIRRQEWID